MTPEEREVQQILGQVDVEMDKIQEKLPWWQKAIIAAALTAAGVAIGAACFGVGAATFSFALLPCLAAAVSALIAIYYYVNAWLSTDEEADAMKAKLDRMEQLAGQTE